jgi:hypothetical protein
LGRPGHLRWSHLQDTHRRAGRAQGRVTRYPISIWEITISILSSPISLAHIPYRYPG